MAHPALGFGDINYARVQAAQRYISKCDQIFVVSGLTRIIDDKSIFDILEEHSRSSSQVDDRIITPSASIICTHAAVCHDMNLLQF